MTTEEDRSQFQSGATQNLLLNPPIQLHNSQQNDREPGAEVNLNDLSDIKDSSPVRGLSKENEEAAPVQVEEKGEVFMEPASVSNEHIDEELVARSLEELSDIENGGAEGNSKAAAIEVDEHDYDALAAKKQGEEAEGDAASVVPPEPVA